MATTLQFDKSASRTAIEKLLDEKAPVLVEVRFPKMGTSSDWFLCDDLAAVEAIFARLSPEAEVHLNSVWDLKNPAGGLVFRGGLLASRP